MLTGFYIISIIKTNSIGGIKMKKIVWGFVLFLALTSVTFSLEESWLSESWLSIGTNFGSYFDNGSDVGNFYIGSPGINLSGYGFWNKKNIGMFFNYGLLFPVVDNKNNYEPVVQGDFILGPGFRYNINEKLKLHFGIGIDVNLFALLDRTNIDIKEATDKRIALGLGGDIGLKYDITDVIYLDFGAALSYNFAGHRLVESTVDNWTNTKRETSGWINGYSMIGIRPYIAIGFNYYQEKGKWGKPK
jgi:hypothetical protein